ncbi:hydantoinase B/oxoprolinase family protein [Agrobacterium tumefaciens]|uniref:hydantoinase B/oxoprolinase family protein n=1 Tax=Agrobacterium tumefaciens TaxID=358 RepID=UPI0012B74831|nr:hydantoinase B/oxoprolinase family protein [Agrobacterium tumefaciens]MQB08034.1 hydantoinase B/oxoprolinase family protein [Agrobacterium tumefaciens]
MRDIQLDPISLEILSNALRSVADETFIALQKSAYSTNIKERHDHSTALFDATGRLIVQSSQALPLHIGAISGTVKTLLRKFKGAINPGDVFVANDPYAAGGSHLPDICIIAPVFHSGRIVGFSGCTAHHADIGGASVGGASGGLTEIFQEGFRIPMIRLFHQGVLDEDLFELMLLNVRGEEERKGDYYAQFAATALGVKRLSEICDRYGADFVEGAFAEIISRTRIRMTAALNLIPTGEYYFEDVMDDDGAGNVDLKIALTIRKTPLETIFDFTGTAPQTPGNINSPLNDTLSIVIFALKCILDPAAPSNEGLFSAIRLIAPPSCLVNPSFPAAVTNRSATDQRVMDVIIGALAKALPSRVVGASNGSNTGIYIYGKDPRTDRDFYFFETMGGGFGGRASKDGKDAVQVYATNTANTPIEAIEREFPLVVEEYSIVEDSGGAGEFRGGCGLRRVIRPRFDDCTFGGTGERFSHQPWGIFGGQAGESGYFAVREPDGKEERLPNKIAKISVSPDQAIVMQTAGSGGYGHPSLRDPQTVDADRRSGKFSLDYITRNYGSP